MSRISAGVRHRPLVTFFVLTFLVSWTAWFTMSWFADEIPAAARLLLRLLGSLVPSSLAIILTLRDSGRIGVARLWRRLLIWRIDGRWYLMLLAPTGMVLLAIAVSRGFGGAGLPSLTMSVGAVAISLALSIFPGSATGEEIGWRGFALPRLQAGRTALVASLTLGVVHGLWHLPLWLGRSGVNTLSVYVPFLLQTIALAVIYTWMINNTRGSLLLAVLFHAATNAPLTFILVPLGARLALPFWIYCGLLVVMAVAVVAICGPADMSHTSHRLQEPPEATAGLRMPGVERNPRGPDRLFDRTPGDAWR
jgi:CAAX protease family protein